MTSWWDERREREAERQAALERLHEEYRAKLAAGDPDAQEASRDWSDNEGTPWRFEVVAGAAGLLAIALVVVVVVLIVLFGVVKDAFGG